MMVNDYDSGGCVVVAVAVVVLAVNVVAVFVANVEVSVVTR